MQEPLLFIPSPPFYYIEEAQEKEKTLVEESTSIFEINRSVRIKDSVIARQLHYFLQPSNKDRHLIFHLKNGESVDGKIVDLKGINVAVKTTDEEVIINANDIDIIGIKD